MKKQCIQSTAQNYSRQGHDGMANFSQEDFSKKDNQLCHEQPRRLLTPDLHLRLIQGIIRELKLEPCGDELRKGCKTIRSECKRDPTLLNYIDDVIMKVMDQLKILSIGVNPCSEEFKDEDEFEKMPSNNSIPSVDQINLAKQISTENR